MSQNYRLTQNIIKSLSKVVDDYGVNGAIAVYTAMHDYYGAEYAIAVFSKNSNARKRNKHI